MQERTERYFPLIDGRIYISLMLDAHREAAERADPLADLSEENYYNPLGKQVMLERNSMSGTPYQYSLDSPQILQEYQRVRERFEEMSANLSENERAAMACRLHEEFAQFLEMRMPDDNGTKASILAFMKQQPSDFAERFAERTSIGMPEVITENLREKMDALDSLSPEQREVAESYLRKESETLLGGALGAVSIQRSDNRETTEKGYIYDRHERAKAVQNVLEEIKRGELDLSSDSEYIRFEALAGNTPTELVHAARGEFGIDGDKIRRKYAESILAQAESLPKGPERNWVLSEMDVRRKEDELMLKQGSLDNWSGREDLADLLMKKLPECGFVRTPGVPDAMTEEAAVADYAKQVNMLATLRSIMPQDLAGKPGNTVVSVRDTLGRSADFYRGTEMCTGRKACPVPDFSSGQAFSPKPDASQEVSFLQPK